MFPSSSQYVPQFAIFSLSSYHLTFIPYALEMVSSFHLYR
jgi:hypothetical protein